MLGYSENKVLKKVDSEPSIITIVTEKSTVGLRFYLSVYNTIEVDWGDGNNHVIANSTEFSHTYSESGEHVITVTGDASLITRFYANNNDAIEIAMNEEADFSNLRYIYIYENNITTFTLPTSVISCARFYAYNCTSLTSLDVSSLTSCSSFYAYNCTSLTSLDVSSLTSCSSFYAYDCTSLTSLDVSSLTSCTNYFRIDNTALTSFTSHIQGSCSRFYAYDCTSLTSLDVSSLTSCSDFHAYNCTSLTSLDVSSLTSCSRYFRIDNTALTNCTISQLTNVSRIYISNMKLTQSEVDAYIAQCLTISGSDTSVFLYITNTATPSATGLANISTLKSRGWFVYHD